MLWAIDLMGGAEVCSQLTSKQGAGREKLRHRSEQEDQLKSAHRRGGRKKGRKKKLQKRKLENEGGDG